MIDGDSEGAFLGGVLEYSFRRGAFDGRVEGCPDVLIGLEACLQAQRHASVSFAVRRVQKNLERTFLLVPDVEIHFESVAGDVVVLQADRELGRSVQREQRSRIAGVGVSVRVRNLPADGYAENGGQLFETVGIFLALAELGSHVFVPFGARGEQHLALHVHDFLLLLGDAKVDVDAVAV